MLLQAGRESVSRLRNLMCNIVSLWWDTLYACRDLLNSCWVCPFFPFKQLKAMPPPKEAPGSESEASEV